MTNTLLQTIGAILLAAGVGTAAPADFMPLAVGNTWTYRNATTGQTFDIRVGTPLMTNDQVYYPLRGFAAKQLYVRVNEYGNLVYLDQDNQVEPVLVGFTASRTAYSSSGRTCPAWARTLEQRAEHSGPAGRWDVLEVEYQPYACADAGDLWEQFAENVGMVRRVVQTIAGPRTYDLVYARIGAEIITAGETGSYSVTAIPNANGEGWDATMRIEMKGNFSVLFPTSQEYDLRLRDADGKVLWTWSEGRQFGQATHTSRLGRQRATITVPYPSTVPEGGQSYILEAWMTTAPGEPQFAAVTTLALQR
ncbi:MAG: BsuPI-related putative proteinase inhibitor [Bryobacteraceae bacterium]